MFKYLVVLVLAIVSTCSCKSYAIEETSKKPSYWDSHYWEIYYQDTRNATDQRMTLELALRYFQIEGVNSGNAVDLGAGTGRDTLFLLKSGWHVLALDAEQQSIDIILERVDTANLQNLETNVSPFSEMRLPKELDLINASRSLPFCHPSDFDKCWETIVSSLADGGRFCGQFYGEHDYLASNPEATTLTIDEVKRLFANRFKIEYLQIDDGLLPCSDGKMYPCHTYHVVAKKIR